MNVGCRSDANHIAELLAIGPLKRLGLKPSSGRTAGLTCHTFIVYWRHFLDSPLERLDGRPSFHSLPGLRNCDHLLRCPCIDDS